jgi:YD repeat-containing protein
MGTASARPDKLQAFVTAGGEIRGELQRRINALRASYDSFQASGGSYPVANPDLMDVELPGFITNYANDETFVAVVRQAFIDADPSYGATGGLAEVGSRSFDTAFRAAARRAGIDPDALLAFRAPATVDEPVAAGIPRTSGFVADPVCTATGHFVEAEDDFTWPDRLAVLRWQRTYSSRFVASGPFGRGWASWATVMLLPQDDGAVAYQGPDGQIALFYPAIGDNGSDGGVDTSDDGSDRTYARVSGVAAELTRVDGGTGWQLTWDWASDHPGEVWTFDGGAGRLQTVTGETVGTTTFVYEAGLLVAVEHDGGRRLDVEWSGDRIAAVRSSCGREARYHYDDAGDLARTERVLGDRRYTTDDQGLVVEVWDADGVRLCHNTYDDDGRVLTQLSPFGRETVFRYEPGNRTVVSDTTDGPVTTYEHDWVGRLVGLIDDHGHHMQRSFDAEGRCVAATGFDGGAATHTFSADGRSATSVGADGVFERWEYDDQRRVVRQQVDGGPELSFDYEGSRAVPTDGRSASPSTAGWCGR